MKRAERMLFLSLVTPFPHCFLIFSRKKKNCTLCRLKLPKTSSRNTSFYLFIFIFICLLLCKVALMHDYIRQANFTTKLLVCKQNSSHLQSLCMVVLFKCTALEIHRHVEHAFTYFENDTWVVKFTHLM